MEASVVRGPEKKKGRAQVQGVLWVLVVPSKVGVSALCESAR